MFYCYLNKKLIQRPNRKVLFCLAYYMIMYLPVGLIGGFIVWFCSEFIKIQRERNNILSRIANELEKVKN